MKRILIRNGQLITMNPQRDIYQADIIVEGKRIASIIPKLQSPIDPAGFDLVIEAAGKIVLPGLIQAHVHLSQTLFRGQADDLELLDWLRQRIWPLEAAHNEESLYYSAMLGGAELIRGGTTCIMDMETVHHTDAAFQAIWENGLRAVSGKVMMDCGEGVPAGLREKATDSIRESVLLLEKWHGRDEGRIRYAFQPRFAVSCTNDLLREVVRLSDHYGVMIHTHASENRSEVDLLRRERGARNIIYLHELGLTGPHLLLAHCIWLDASEMEILRQSGTSVVHCPSSNLKLASGLAPVPEYLEKGITVALGADGAPCANNLDMFQEMRLAALIHKVRYGPTAMPAAQVLEMATLGGARAMNLAEEIGSLEVGKRADLIIVNLNQIHSLPETEVDPLSRLVYSARASDVETTIIDGRVVMLNRVLLTINESEVREKCNRLIQKILQRI